VRRRNRGEFLRGGFYAEDSYTELFMVFHEDKSRPITQLGDVSLDAGPNYATGSEIVANELTAGITTFEYAYVDTVSGGTPLFYTAENSPFVECTGCTSVAPVTPSQTSGVPEPATYAMLGSGLLAMGALRIRVRWRGIP
jgi:hypothetical protein